MRLTPATTPAFRRRFGEPLHVVATVSNFARFHSRYRIFRDWCSYMRSVPGVRLYVVELALGDAPHEVTSRWRRRQLQLRTDQELWYKEACINEGVRQLLPADWRYLMWADADVWFHREDWVEATLHALQRYPVVQPWSECVDLGPRGNALAMLQSFCHMQGQAQDQDPRVRGMEALRGLFQQQPAPGGESSKGPMGHTGYAWACRRDFWDKTKGLMEYAILGTADCHMAWGCVGKASLSYPEGASASFKEYCLAWEKAALEVTGGRVGCVPGMILHAWHGPKSRRRYDERWDIMLRHDYSPKADVTVTGEKLTDLFRLREGREQLLAEVREYFSGRDEDSNEEFI